MPTGNSYMVPFKGGMGSANMRAGEKRPPGPTTPPAKAVPLHADVQRCLCRHRLMPASAPVRGFLCFLAVQGYLRTRLIITVIAIFFYVYPDVTDAFLALFACQLVDPLEGKYLEFMVKRYVYTYRLAGTVPLHVEGGGRGARGGRKLCRSRQRVAERCGSLQSRAGQARGHGDTNSSAKVRLVCCTCDVHHVWAFPTVTSHC